LAEIGVLERLVGPLFDQRPSDVEDLPRIAGSRLFGEVSKVFDQALFDVSGGAHVSYSKPMRLLPRSRYSMCGPVTCPEIGVLERLVGPSEGEREEQEKR
jgi:hypothetical protein